MKIFYWFKKTLAVLVSLIIMLNPTVSFTARPVASDTSMTKLELLDVMERCGKKALQFRIQSAQIGRRFAQRSVDAEIGSETSDKFQAYLAKAFNYLVHI